MDLLTKGRNMKTTCTKVMQEIAAGDVRSSATEQHLAECPDCALFLRINSLEADHSGIPVPEHLDAAVLAEARKYTARRRWRLWKIALPIAASFVLSFGIAFYSLLPEPVPKKNAVAAAVQTPSLFEYDDSLIVLSCEVANGASLITNVYEISNQGAQTI